MKDFLTSFKPQECYAPLIPIAMAAGSALAASGTAAATMSTVGTVMSLAGAATGLVGSMRQASAIKASGRARQRESEYRAEQSRVAAGQERASSQRQSIEEARQGRLRQSAITAQAAAGGQSSSENVLNIMGDMDYETQYRKSLALFEGEKSASSLEQSGLLTQYEGGQEMSAAKTRASATRMNGITDFATSIGGTLYNKYAPKTGGVGTRPDTVNWNQGGSSLVGYY